MVNIFSIYDQYIIFTWTIYGHYGSYLGFHNLELKNQLYYFFPSIFKPTPKLIGGGGRG